ncbi:Hsp20/alpha crystallin family protein [Ostertagia ostertagi]
MDLWGQMMHRMMNDYFRDFNRWDRSLYPYWRHADHSVMHVADETQQVVDDDKKFAVSVDVSQFHPEELKGESRWSSFIRKWTLPETVNLEAIRTQLSDAGHLSIEAPKVTATSTQRRTIPIERAPSQ